MLNNTDWKFMYKTEHKYSYVYKYEYNTKYIE